MAWKNFGVLCVEVVFLLLYGIANAAIFTVNSTASLPDSFAGDGICDTANDPTKVPPIPPSGICTLWAAIDQANVEPGLDTIVFDLPGPGPHAIQGRFQPIITDPVVIDGYTQSGSRPNSHPITQGANAKLMVAVGGLQLASGNSTVRGLVLSGIHIAGFNGGNVIAGNFIGTDMTGTVALSDLTGVRIIDSPNNMIGGTTPAARNIIAGNTAKILIQGTSQDNVIRGNFIGTDVTGTVALGMQGAGVIIQHPARNNTIGGTTVAARNLISGNGTNFSAPVPGIFLSGEGTLVQGNYIGTDVTGTQPLGNGQGIATGIGDTIGGTPGTTPGGPCTGACNLIAASKFWGVTLGRNTLVQGNYIGTDVTGTRRLGNGNSGVHVFEEGFGNIIGGATPQERNIISGNLGSGLSFEGSHNLVQGNYIGTDVTGTKMLGNGGDGVSVDRIDPQKVVIGNAILSNTIAFNEGLGINLRIFAPPRVDAVTPNDSGDMDTGPNNLQNFPELVSARVTSGGTTVVWGTLASTPKTAFRLEFFANIACDPSGYGEGEHFLDSTTVSTNNDGKATFSITIPFAVPVDHFLTATATDPDNNTSEFSQCLQVKPACEVAGGGSPTIVQFKELNPCIVPGVQTVEWGGGQPPAFLDFGTKPILEADSGDKLHVECFGSGPIPSYFLVYTPSGSTTSFRVAECPFECGFNSHYFTTPGDKDGNKNPDCFMGTVWTSKDYGQNDSPRSQFTLPESRDLLDHVIFTFDANRGFLTKENIKYEYLMRLPLPCGFAAAGLQLEGACVDEHDTDGKCGEKVDPPVGPETEALFANLLVELQAGPPPLGPMESNAFNLCDFNYDGHCNAVDFQVFTEALHTCRGDSGFYPDADIDVDGCVTEDDMQILFPAAPTDTIPPTTTATPSPPPNANDWNNTHVTIILTAVDNPGGSGVKDISFSLSGATTGGHVVTSSNASVTISAEGSTTLTYFAHDNAGNQESPKTLTVQLDKTLPVIAGLPAASCTLWPPNHQLVQVATVTASDALSGVAPSSLVVTGTSNEPTQSQDDGDLAPDIIITGGTVQLRAERLGSGTGRLYTLTATVSDQAGNTATATALCTVPHDQGKK